MCSLKNIIYKLREFHYIIYIAKIGNLINNIFNIIAYLFKSWDKGKAYQVNLKYFNWVLVSFLSKLLIQKELLINMDCNNQKFTMNYHENMYFCFLYFRYFVKWPRYILYFFNHKLIFLFQNHKRNIILKYYAVFIKNEWNSIMLYIHINIINKSLNYRFKI